MTTPRNQPLDLVATVQWIERHLDDALNVEMIADIAGLSPYHFSRLFSARMGRGVMAHVRGRRLVRAAQRLAADPELRLIISRPIVASTRKKRLRARSPALSASRRAGFAVASISRPSKDSIP